MKSCPVMMEVPGHQPPLPTFSSRQVVQAALQLPQPERARLLQGRGAQQRAEGLACKAEAAKARGAHSVCLGHCGECPLTLARRSRGDRLQGATRLKPPEVAIETQICAFEPASTLPTVWLLPLQMFRRRIAEPAAFADCDFYISTSYISTSTAPHIPSRSCTWVCFQMAGQALSGEELQPSCFRQLSLRTIN